MYTLYGSRGTASTIPHILMEEIGTPYRFVPVSLRELRDPECLKINPHGKVPALLLPEGQPVYETAAIVMTLTDRHPEAELAPAMEHPLRPLYYQWLTHLSNSIQATYLAFFFPARWTSNAAGVDAVRAQAQKNVHALWRHLDRSLAEAGPYALGNRFSAVDIYLSVLAGWDKDSPTLFAECPALKACIDQVKTRPAWQRVTQPVTA